LANFLANILDFLDCLDHVWTVMFGLIDGDTTHLCSRINHVFWSLSTKCFFASKSLLRRRLLFDNAHHQEQNSKKLNGNTNKIKGYITFGPIFASHLPAGSIICGASHNIILTPRRRAVQTHLQAC
jgi:hypothetical protein